VVKRGQQFSVPFTERVWTGDFQGAEQKDTEHFFKITLPGMEETKEPYKRVEHDTSTGRS
jgi:hypothetical protein